MERPAAESTVRFTAKFVPSEQRRPVVYELAGGIPAVKVTINGREAWAVLDNGTSITLLDEAFARSLGLHFDPEEARPLFTSIGPLERRRVIERVDLAIPGEVAMQTPVFAADLLGVSAITGRPISLILGKEYFDVMVFVFTPRNRRVKLGASGTLRGPTEMAELVLLDDRPSVELMIGGQRVVLAIDLGYNGEIALSQHAWTRLGMGAQPAVARRSLDARGSGSSTVMTTVDEVALGPRRVRDVDIALSPEQLVERDGFVGFGLLSRFNFALDIKARRLWLIPPYPAE